MCAPHPDLLSNGVQLWSSCGGSAIAVYDDWHGSANEGPLVQGGLEDARVETHHHHSQNWEQTSSWNKKKRH